MNADLLLATRSSPLLVALETHARERGSHTALHFLARGDTVTASVDYATLMRDVGAMAAGLLARGLAGRPVVLALPPGIRFVTALLACLRAGAIAVPVPFPPTGDGRERVAMVLADLRGPTVLVENQASAAGIDPALELDALLREAATALPPLPADDAPAVIQYSSGSTRRPRSIVLSHGNIGANAAMVREIFGTHAGSIVVNWLPPHHDMGLFGAILQPLFVGATAVLMPPFAFIQRPLRWLRAIAEHGGSMAGGPNFAYELCVRRVTPEQAAELDLSRLAVAFCGAEPIRAASLRRFAEHFAGTGFDPAAFLPCYGLAEATLLVSGVLPGTGVREVSVCSESGPARLHVACGQVPSGSRITIRDPETFATVPPDEPGEICVAGPHVAIGEWDGATGTLAPLEATIEEGAARWLRTGDIGVLAGAGLVVLDRLKDIITLHGRNIHAADVEAAALERAGQAVPAAAAFGTVGPERDELVLLCEVPVAERRRRDLDTLGPALAAAVGERCGIVPRVEFLAFGALPRTTSGKIRRHAARQDFRAGRLRILAMEG